MMPVVVYAVVPARLPEPLPPGAAGEPLAQVDVHGVVGIVGSLPDKQTADEANLLQYADVVDRLAARADSVLPARWGSTFPSVEVARAALASRAEPLAQALGEAAGRGEGGIRGDRPRTEERRGRRRAVG